MRLICFGVNAFWTILRSSLWRGLSIAMNDCVISRNSGGSASNSTPCPETNTSLLVLTVEISAWETTAQYPGSSGSGATAFSIGRCHETGSSRRSRAKVSSRSSAVAFQNSAPEMSMAEYSRPESEVVVSVCADIGRLLAVGGTGLMWGICAPHHEIDKQHLSPWEERCTPGDGQPRPPSG